MKANLKKGIRLFLRPRVAMVFSVVIISTLLIAARPANPSLNQEFEKIIERYLAEFHGFGTATSPLNDGSAAYYGRRLDNMHVILNDMQKIDRSTLTFDQDIDYQYLEGLLKSRIRGEEKVKRWQQDPRLYMSVEPIISPRGGLLYEETLQLKDRAERILKVMGTIPTRLENAKNLFKCTLIIFYSHSHGMQEKRTS